MDKATGYGDHPVPKPPMLMYDCYVLSHAIGSDLSDYESYAKERVKIGQQYNVPLKCVEIQQKKFWGKWEKDLLGNQVLR